MTKRLLTFAATFCSASALYGQCTASASGSSVAAAEINARMCAAETFVAGTGGVTVNTLVIRDTSSPAKVIPGTGADAYGVALSTVSAGASLGVQRYGQVSLVMENAATAGHLVTIGTSTVTDGHDSGYTLRSSVPVTTRIVGVLITSASAGSTATVELSPDTFGTLVTSGSHIGVSLNAVSGSQAVPSGGFTVVQFVAPYQYDYGGFSNLGSSATALTVPTGMNGIYILTGGWSVASGGYTATDNMVIPLVNGSTIAPTAYGECNSSPQTGGAQYQPTVSCTMQTHLNDGDVVTLEIAQNSGSVQTIQNAYFQLVRVN